MEFHENPSSGWRVVPWGRVDRQTGRHDEANSRFSRFYESAWKSLTGFSNFLSITPKSTFCYEEHTGLFIGLQASCRTWAPMLSRLCDNCCLTLHKKLLCWRYKAIGFEWRHYESNLNVAEANSAQSIKITLQRIKAQVRMCWSNLPCSSACLDVIGPIVRKFCHVIK